MRTPFIKLLVVLCFAGTQAFKVHGQLALDGYIKEGLKNAADSIEYSCVK